MNRRLSYYTSFILVTLAAAFLSALPVFSEETAGTKHLDSIEGTHIWEATQELPFQPGGTLAISNRNGDIDVETWDRPLVWMKARMRMQVRKGGSGLFGLGSKRLPFDSIQEAEDYFKQLRVEITGNDKDLRIETKFPEQRRNVSLSISYEIRLPRQAQLNMGTSNGALSAVDLKGSLTARSSNGRITVRNIEGYVQMRTSNGKIVAENLVGTVKAESSNGKVECQAVSGNIEARTSNGKVVISCPGVLSASDSIWARTSNGDIEISLGEGSSFELDAGTSNGKISTDFPVTMSGQISRKNLVGSVGAGGPKVELQTSNGSIEINKI